MSKVNISFFTEPTKVYEFLKDKKQELHFDYDEIAHEAHKRVFTIAKITKADLLKDIQESLIKSFKEGIGFAEWKQNIEPLLAKKGWLGKVIVKNPNTDEEKEIYVGSRRLKTIFNTNIRTAYAKANYDSQMQSSAQYFRYVALLDKNTRASHRRLHGTILPKTDPFWDKNYPPNDWNCRCKVQVLTKSYIEKNGLTPLDSGDNLADISGKDFAYSLRDSNKKLDEILKIKQQRALNSFKSDSAKEHYKNSIKNFGHDRDMYVWQNSLNNMLSAVVSGNIIKDKIFQVAQIGELKSNVKNGLKTLNVTTKANTIAIYQNTISHITRDSKPKAKEPNINEIKAIVGVLDSAKHCFYDKEKKNLLYFYPSMQDDGMANYVIVNLDYVLKKFKTDNFVATISKMPIINFKNIAKNKIRYKKLK